MRPWAYTALAVCLCVSCLSVSELCAQDVATRTPAESLQEFSTRILPADTELAHPPLMLDFGPSRGNIVILFNSRKEGFGAQLAGWALMPVKPNDGSYRKYSIPVPAPKEGGPFALFVKAVFSAPIGDSSQRELVILYDNMSMLPGNRAQMGDAHDFSAGVYHWTGSGFKMLDEVQKALDGLDTAVAIRKKLRTLKEPK